MFVCRVVREGRVERSSENSLDGRPVIASGGGQAVRRRAIRTRDTRWVLGKLVEDCLIREGAVTRRVCGEQCVCQSSVKPFA